MDKSNTTLTGEIKAGNEQALKELYNRYHKQLYYVGKRYLKSEALAEDAVQDVFLKVWDKKQNLDEALSIEGFLFTMMKNHLLNMIRKEDNRKKMINEVKKTAKTRESAQKVEEKVIYSEYENVFNKALNKLSPAKRDVFKLRSMEGLSNEEVAAKRNVSKHTVKTQYYLGSKFIRNVLKKRVGLFTLILMML